MFKSEGDSRSWVRDCRASTSVIFGFAAVPVLLALGVAVEFSAWHRAQVELQTLSDAAARAAADAYAAGSDAYQEIVGNYIAANRKGGLLENVPVVPIATPRAADNTMTVASTVQVSTTLGPLVGQDRIEITATSKVMLPAFSDHHETRRTTHD